MARKGTVLILVLVPWLLLGCDDEAGRDAQGYGQVQGQQDGSDDPPPTREYEPSPPPPPGALLAFVTATTYPGNISSGSSRSGAPAGDELCTLHAEAAGLGGEWVAWLGDWNSDPRERLTGAGPWYLTDGETLIAPNRAALLAHGPIRPVDRDELGRRVPESTVLVWTGSNRHGTGTTQSCASWSNRHQYSGIYGDVSLRSGGDGDWTELDLAECSSELRVFCLEQ